MSSITTYTGKSFDPTAPDASVFDVRDIAHALSLTCRGNGHVKTFFSVGQHCINCAREAELRGYSPRIALACLLHDASEAYMSDVPRPFKAAMPEYVQAEEKILDLIYERFLGSTLNEEEHKIIKTIDDDMLYYDMEELLNVKMAGEPPQLKISLDYTVVPFEQVERTYLELYEKWNILQESQR